MDPRLFPSLVDPAHYFPPNTARAVEYEQRRALDLGFNGHDISRYQMIADMISREVGYFLDVANVVFNDCEPGHELQWHHDHEKGSFDIYSILALEGEGDLRFRWPGEEPWLYSMRPGDLIVWDNAAEQMGMEHGGVVYKTPRKSLAIRCNRRW